MTATERAAEPGRVAGSAPLPLWLVAVLSVVVLAAACSSEEPPAPTTTTGTALPSRTTLPSVSTTAPSGSTTTTVRAEIATNVDACALVAPREARPAAGEDAGPGTPVEVSDLPGVDQPSMADRGENGDDQVAAPAEEADTDPPSLLLSGCSWPTDGPPQVILSYLAPTTSGSALQHLQRLIDLDSPFSRGGRVFPLPPRGDLGPAALLDESGAVIEVAVVTGSALLYVVPSEPPASGTPDADALVALLMAAARRAPG